MRKLGRASEAAMLGIETQRQLMEGRLQQTGLGQVRSSLGFETGQRLQQTSVLLADRGALFAIGALDPDQQLRERRQTMTRLTRKIGAGEKRRVIVRREKDRQRPAAGALAQKLMRGLIDLVEIRSLLAIDLDVDEQPVHQLSRRRVFEGLVRHHMAPVTGRIADREQDRAVMFARQRQSLRAPGPPVDRIVGVLLEIGAGGGRQPVGTLGVAGVDR